MAVERTAVEVVEVVEEKTAVAVMLLGSAKKLGRARVKAPVGAVVEVVGKKAAVAVILLGAATKLGPTGSLLPGAAKEEKAAVAVIPPGVAVKQEVEVVERAKAAVAACLP